jgi:hypothetical protein
VALRHRITPVLPLSELGSCYCCLLQKNPPLDAKGGRNYVQAISPDNHTLFGGSAVRGVPRTVTLRHQVALAVLLSESRKNYFAVQKNKQVNEK